jgi:hypothetical protein
MPVSDVLQHWGKRESSGPHLLDEQDDGPRRRSSSSDFSQEGIFRTGAVVIVRAEPPPVGSSQDLQFEHRASFGCECTDSWPANAKTIV